MTGESSGPPAEDVSSSPGWRDRLLARLLADPSFFLVDESDAAAILASEQGTEIALVACPEGSATGVLRRSFRALAAASRVPVFQLVAVGGGAEVARELAACRPILPRRRALGFHHLDAEGALRRVVGRSCSALVVAARGLPAAEPLGPDSIATHRRRGAERFGSGRPREPLSARFPWVTATIGALCAVLYALGAVWSEWDIWFALDRMGANDQVQVRAGEVWRLLSSSLLHARPSHLLFNLISLALFGSFLEQLLGPRRFLLLYGLSALGAGLASALLRGPGLSVGASGAIWGLMTASLGLLIRPRGLLPPLRLARLCRWTAPYYLLNVVYSFDPHIDLHAHFHGGLVGFALVLTGVVTRGVRPTWTRPDPGETRPERSVRLTLAASGLAVALVGSAAIAIAVGQPWRGEPAPIMTRVVLPTTDLALELPDRIARSPLDEVEAAAQSFTFGGLGADPIAVRVVVSPVPIAPDQVTNALAVMRDLLQSGTPEGAERLGDAQTIIVAGHPGVVVAYRGEDVTIHSWVIILDGRQIALLVYLSSELPRSWRGVENRIAESLAGR